MRGKHAGSKTPYFDDRNKELLLAFRKAKKTLLEEKGYIRLEEALDIARHSRCSRFFVSENRASLVLRKMIAFDRQVDRIGEGDCERRPEDPLGKMLYQRRRMFSHLYAVYKRIKAEQPGSTHEELVTMACATPADEFYLTINSTCEILNRITRSKKSK